MKTRVLSLLFLSVLVISSLGMIPALPLQSVQPSTLDDLLSNSIGPIPEEIVPAVEQAIAEDNPYLPGDYDIGSVLGDRDADYKIMYEPWKSQAAIHAIEYHEPTGFLALAGGYLYDNEVHLFRLNVETNKFDKVWDTGDGVFQSDVMSLAFGDTDLNDFLEIVAGCADGHVYVFEQKHIYDPYTNTENQFELVWRSPDMFRAFAVKVDDIDHDYRPDIIAGGWDGYVHIYEYDDHSGYPFNEEHWISYREVASLPVADKVYSLETGDTNSNGLPEVIVGTRDGTVYVFENDGITLMINGYPFPLINDNHYYLNWTSENYTWTPIVSMAVGELDGDIGDELAIVAQGQGVFTLEWDTSKKTYMYQKVVKEYDAWETFGYWGLDYYADRVIEAWNVTYHDPDNASINVPEPIQYVWGGSYFLPDADVYPFNTGMAGAPDGNFSEFDASSPSVDNATAIIDFGRDEEGTGSANAEPDVLIKFPGMFIVGADLSPYFNFSISKDGTDFEQVTSDHFIYSGYYLKIDVDDALSRRKWDYFQFAKITVFNGAKYSINSVELAQVYNLITDALAVTIGPLKENGPLWASGGTEANKIVVGTVIGELLGIKYNSSTEIYDLFWESGDDDYYTYGANIWDIEYVGTPTNLPNWDLKGAGYFTPTGGYEANSWGFGIPAPLSDNLWTAWLAQNLPGGGDAQIRAYDHNFVYDPLTQPLLVEINNDIAPVNYGFEYVSVENPWLLNNYGSDISVMVIGGLDEDISLDAAMETPLYRGNILFYYRTSSSAPWNNYNELWQLDTDGQLAGLVNLATVTPRTDFADYDGDGDFDFVVSNGRLYMAENVQDETGTLNFTLVPGYFDAINEIESSKIWGQPDLHDLDGDGDLDLVLSYDGRNGATSFINEGTFENPIWVENKKIMSNTGELTNLNLLNLTNVRLLPDYGNYLDGPFLERYYEFAGWEKPDFFMYSYNSYTDSIWMCSAESGSSDAYMVATYPSVSRLQINIMSGEIGSFYNLGFHVMEDWNNDFDLEDWTLAIASGDTDSDGNNEIIIGDYDNNVYAFEHLVNNTYKRMFRSFDLNHTEVSDESPYAYEDLEGISGDFKRKIWDHAEHLIADVDLDQDGLKEIIVAANLQLYIFEEQGLFGGDAVRYVYSFDLRDTQWGNRVNFKDFATKITAIAAGDDIDQDGRMELAVAAGPYLFVYNINHDSFDDLEDNDFYITSYIMEGRYYLPGNGENSQFKYYQINAMTMCDTDKDGYREIIFGGIQDIRLVRQNGFAYIYECVGGSFQRSWIAPTEITRWNPITVITLDDQDYDGETEIIFGHSQGFDMWEHIPGVDNGYQKVEYVTASPNYPILPVKTTMFGSEIYSQAGRSIKDVAFFETGAGVGFAYMVYESQASTPQIFVKTYIDSIDIWSAGVPLQNYITYSGNSSNIVSEYKPSVTTTTDGDVYIAWEAYDAGGTHYLAMLWGEIGVGWHTAMLLPETTGMFWVDRFTPGVFEFNATHIGMVYTYQAALSISDIGCRIIRKDMTGGYFGVPLNFNNYNRMRTHDIDAVRLADGRIAVALSAENIDTYKPDHDIWVAVSNDDFNWTGVNPHQATTSYSEEMFVDIDYLRTDDKSLVVLYEVLDAELEERFKMVASQDDGASWSVPEELNTLPDTVTRTEYPGGYVTYSVPQPTSYSPAFCARPDAGFLYTFTFSYVMHVKVGDQGWYRWLFPDIVYGQNFQSDWALNHLREVVDLDVGDTDGDGRREVVVGFDHQVAMYEMKSSNNGTSFMYYLEDWLSDEYANPVTGVAVSDSNGNGWDDIAVACERGEVYFLEYIDVSEGISPLRGSVVNWTAISTGYGWFGGSNPIASYDIDQDGKEELITAPYSNNRAQAFDDDGTSLWNNTDSSAGFKRLVLADINNDTVPEVLLAGFDGMIWVLDIADGSEVWSYDTGSAIEAIDVADADLDGNVEIAVGTAGDSLYLLHDDGTLYHSWALAAGDIEQVKFGNFTGASNLTVAMVQGTRISLVNPFNGTILYQTPSSYAAILPAIKTADFNDDGLDDLVFARFGIHVLDLSTGEFIYNSTPYSTSWYVLEVLVDDFDGDDSLEVVAWNVQGHIYMEDIKAGVTQWHYSADTVFNTYDVDTGHFGGSGELDLIVGLVNSTSGVMVALDGKNGIPIWFNKTNGWPYAVYAADIHGTGMDTAFSWDLGTFEILGIDSYERVLPETEYVFPAHTLYYEKSFTNVSIYGTAAEDLNADGIDEIVTWDNNGTIYLLNGTNGALLWSVQVPGIIQKVDIGNMDGTGWWDIVLFDDNDDFYVLSGTNGAQIGTIANPTNFYPQDFYVENFNAAQSNDEIAILWQDGTHVFIGWYNHDGTLHYKSSMNITATVYNMAVGDITGDGLPDVAIGGTNEAIVVYTGTNGVFYSILGTGGSSVYDLIVGNFTGDAYADFVWMDSIYDLHLVNGGTNTQIYVLPTLYLVLDFAAGDVDGDGKDELVVYAEKSGVYAYNEDTTEAMRFIAPLLLNSWDSSMSVADMNDDGYEDIVFVNYEYLDIIDGHTGDLLWHYVITGGAKVFRPNIGHFVGTSGPMDVVFHRLDTVYVVSGTYPAPAPPAPILPMMAAAVNFGEVVAVVAGIGLPVVFLLFVPIGLIWYRKRKELE